MKITKRQLKRIIREENAKLINESRLGERALGLYADTLEVDTLKKQITSFIDNVWANAADDGLEIEEASEMAELAFADLAAEAAGTLGMMRLRQVLYSIEGSAPE